MFYIGLYREKKLKKNFLSETTRFRALVHDMYHHLVDLYQVCSNYAPWAKNGPPTEVTQAYIKSTFSEYVHFAYQIKGSKTYNNMLANALPIHCT